MELQTKRLLLRPLKTEEFALYLQGNHSLDQETRETFQHHLYLAKKYPKDALWYTCWLILLPEKGQVAGQLSFTGPPDEQGNVEIGYATEKLFQKQGYMTEALTAVAAWGLAQPGVRKIIAETKEENASSCRVLEKCGFQLYLNISGCMFWGYSKEEG